MMNSRPDLPPTESHQLEPIRLTREEEQFYKDCSRQALSKRGLPYGSCAAIGAYAALKFGFLKPHVKYGYLPIVTIASFVGTFTGLVSHNAECFQQVLERPDSQLKKKIEAIQRPSGRQIPLASSQSLEEPSTETEYEPMFSGLEVGNYQSTNDLDGFSSVNTSTNSLERDDFYMEPLDKFHGISTTYDELRQKNRDEYIRSQGTRTQPGPTNSRSTIRQPDSRSQERDIPFDRDRVPQYQLND